MAAYETDLNLKLGLPGTQPASTAKCNKRSLAADGLLGDGTSSTSKAQVVGWPPIRSYRRNALGSKKAEEEAGDAGGMYVKVSMDGAPYLRKMDLKVYNGYPQLFAALREMFSCFSLGDFSDGKGCSGSEHMLTYEDRDGDWMLAGDVPWEMFVSSCKKLRIMNGAEAIGLRSWL